MTHFEREIKRVREEREGIVPLACSVRKTIRRIEYVEVFHVRSGGCAHARKHPWASVGISTVKGCGLAR